MLGPGSALGTRCDRGSPKLIKLQIAKGSDPYSGDRNGDNVLTWALQGGDPSIVTLLGGKIQPAIRAANLTGTDSSQLSRSPSDAIQKRQAKLFIAPNPSRVVRAIWKC